MIWQLKQRWHSQGGYAEVLRLAFPLILSTGSWSIQHFVDRMFLTWYSAEAIAAALPASMVNFTFMSLFIGTASYVNTFVAQYYGAGRYQRIGPAVWQGIYFAGLAGIAMLGFVPLGEKFFELSGHELPVQRLEMNYFRILCFGAAPVVVTSTTSGFFTGRGQTWPVLWVNVTATGVNLTLDYALIFGHWGFPEWGIRGAAMATVASGCFSAAMFLILMIRPRFRAEFHTLRGWRLDAELFRRLLRYGLPHGVQFMLDVLGFTLFLLLVGRLGTIPLAATNVAFNINSLAFMPMIGFGISVSILVGQRLGQNQPRLAVYSTWSAFHLTFTYMATIAAAYVLLPQLFVMPFGSRARPEDFEALSQMIIVLLRFVALYSLFDTMNIIFASAIKGAGDTRFVMVICVLFSWVLMVIPSYFACVVFNWGLYWAWGFASLYIAILGLAFLWRFSGGKWQSMRVIEEIPHSVITPIPEVPSSEFEL